MVVARGKGKRGQGGVSQTAPSFPYASPRVLLCSTAPTVNGTVLYTQDMLRGQILNEVFLSRNVINKK